MARKRARFSRRHHKGQDDNQSDKILDRRKFIRLGCLNSDGWSIQKEFDVQGAIEAKNIDIFSVIETHLKKGDKDKLAFNGFSVFETRRSEKDKKGGGIAVFARKSSGVAYKRHSPKIEKPELHYVESERIWITYESQQGKTAVCSLYLGCQAPGDKHTEWNQGILQVLSEEVRDLRSQGFRVILQGDWNSHVGNKLEEGGIPGNQPTSINTNGKLFLSFLKDNSLTHLNGAVRVPGDWTTRVCEGMWTWHSRNYSNSTVLDYVVVSSEHIRTALNMEVDEGAVFGGASDHNMIFSRFSDKFTAMRTTPKVHRASWNLNEDTDFSKFRSIVSREMEEMPSLDGGVESLSGYLTKALTKGLDEGVGKRVPLPEKAKVYPRHIVQLLKERKQLENSVKTLRCHYAASRHQAPPPSLMVEIGKLDDKTEELEVAKARFGRQRRAPLLNLARQKGRRASKKFWSFINNKLRKSGDIPSIVNSQTGALVHSPEDISQEIRRYLVKIFSGHDQNPHSEETEEDIIVSDQRVPQNCHDVNPSKKSRLDSFLIPPDASHNSGHIDCHDVDPSKKSTSSSSNFSSTAKSKSAGSPDVDPSKNPQGGDSVPEDFLDRPFTPDEVKSVINTLKDGKAAGHDHIPNEALKNAPDSFLRHLIVLFNRVKDQSTVPRAWKRGRVVLIHKSGDEADIMNYRPITVLTCMSSTFSKTLDKRLRVVVENKNILGESQNGFRKGRSGEDSAFVLHSILWKASAKKKKTHLAFLDVAKAYDSVNRQALRVHKKPKNQNCLAWILKNFKAGWQGESGEFKTVCWFFKHCLLDFLNLFG